MSRSVCFAAIRREFYNKDGSHDGGETEYVYSDNPISNLLREITTLEEARKILGPQNSDVYGRIEITEVQTHRGCLP